MFAAITMICITIFCLNINSQNQRDTPPIEPVAIAKMVDSINAVWADGRNGLPGETISTGNLSLINGYAEIKLDNGVDIIIGAPADFTIHSADSICIYLNLGQVTAYVPPEAIGFTVRTPNARIIDIGTEFGVSVDPGGNTNVQVFDGNVALATNSISGINIIRKGQAVRVTKNRIINITPTQYPAFTRTISSDTGFIWSGEPIDLADIVGGGSGFKTGTIGRGINPANGKLTDNQIIEYRYSNNKYQTVEESAFIDGVFIPDSTTGSIVCNSQGNTINNIPLSNGQCHTGIFSNLKKIQFNKDSKPTTPFLDGVALETNISPYILMHSNTGITFSLDAFRSWMPQLNIEHFSATIGIPESIANIFPEVEFCAYLDGRLIYQSNNSIQMSEYIIFKIDPFAKFLTLVVTEGNDGPNNDFLMIVKPELKLSRHNCEYK